MAYQDAVTMTRVTSSNGNDYYSLSIIEEAVITMARMVSLRRIRSDKDRDLIVTHIISTYSKVQS